jgi:predicted RNA-binding Zn-ribbon protein involved in translation (DUF1610 family)
MEFLAFDVFISYATEDKDDIVGPIALELRRLNYSVWFDDFSLELGDSLRRSIDKGLSNSRFGVVVLSPNFFAKNWTQYELDSLTQRELSEEQKVILPIWHNVSRADVSRYSLRLADKVAIDSSLGVTAIALKISAVLGPPAGVKILEMKEEPCPKCGKPVISHTYKILENGSTSGGLECQHCGYFDAWGALTEP